MKKNIIVLGLLSVIAISCGESVEKNVEELVESEELCTFAYDPAATTVGWTAFKYTEKKGVNGVFDKVDVLIAHNSEDMLQTLSGASFTIPIESVNTENPDRDYKIQNSFFGTMQSSEVISGIIKSIDSEKAVVEISMNGMSIEYEGKVSVEGQKVNFRTTIDMVDFESQKSIDSLNSVCIAVHTGSDGISKLWSEVDINVETTLVKECK
jgi:hypothetical protein